MGLSCEKVIFYATFIFGIYSFLSAAHDLAMFSRARKWNGIEYEWSFRTGPFCMMIAFWDFSWFLIVMFITIPSFMLIIYFCSLIWAMFLSMENQLVGFLLIFFLFFLEKDFLPQLQLF